MSHENKPEAELRHDFAWLNSPQVSNEERELREALTRDFRSPASQAHAADAADATLTRLLRITPPSQRSTLETPLGTLTGTSKRQRHRTPPARPPTKPREHPLVPWGPATVTTAGSLARSATEPRLEARPAPRLHPKEQREGDELHDTFGADAAELLASELTRTSRVLKDAERSWTHARHQSTNDFAQREREIRQRVQEARRAAKAEERQRLELVVARERATATKAVASAGNAAAMQSTVMRMASQVSKQRQALEKELGKEAQRASERAAAEDAWATHVRALEQQVDEELRRAQLAEGRIAELESEQHDRFEYLARLAMKRIDAANVRHAWRGWADAARRRRTEIRHATAIGAGVRRVFERVGERAAFLLWLSRCRKENLREALRLQQESEAANATLRLSEARVRKEVAELTAELADEQRESAQSEAALRGRLEESEATLEAERRAAREKMLSHLQRQSQRRQRLLKMHTRFEVWLELCQRVHAAHQQQKAWEPAIAAFRRLRYPPAPQFGKWCSRWKLRVAENERARREGAAGYEGIDEMARARAALEERVEREASLRLAAEAESERHRAHAERAEQALSLERTGHEETRSLLHTARYELAQAQRVERKATETAARRSAAERREIAALDQARRAEEALAAARTDAHKAAAEQKRLAEEQLARLLAAQRRELEAKMEQMAREHSLQLEALRRKYEGVAAAAAAASGSARGRTSRSPPRSRSPPAGSGSPAPPAASTENYRSTYVPPPPHRSASGPAALARRGFGFFSQQRALHRSSARLGYDGEVTREEESLTLAREAARSPWLAARPDHSSMPALTPYEESVKARVERARADEGARARASYGSELLRLTTRRQQHDDRSDRRMLERAGSATKRRATSATAVWNRLGVYEEASAATSLAATSFASTSAGTSRVASSSISVPRSAPPPPPSPPPPSDRPRTPPGTPETTQTAPNLVDQLMDMHESRDRLADALASPPSPQAQRLDPTCYTRSPPSAVLFGTASSSGAAEPQPRPAHTGSSPPMASAEAPGALEAAWERVKRVREERGSETGSADACAASSSAVGSATLASSSHLAAPGAVPSDARTQPSSRYLGSGVW